MKKEKKQKKDWNKRLCTVLLVLLILEICLIPCLIYAEVKKVLPIVGFLILPTLGSIIILLLGKNCTLDFEKKKQRLLNK